VRKPYKSRHSSVYKLGASKRLYNSWRSMHNRCYHTSYHSFAGYGGRGIAVCKRWHTDNPSGFKNFFLDMGNPPEGLSLDRIDVNGNYTPTNCRWASKSQQSKGRRKFGSLTSYDVDELAVHVASLSRRDIERLFGHIIRILK
jgi:hypothetical protein